MTSKTADLTEFFRGSSYIEGPLAGLAAYHAAKAVIHANRRVGTDRRGWHMKQALKQFRIIVT